MMTANEMAALIRLFGSEEKARQWLEENVDTTNRAIETAGMITRSQDQPQDDPQPQGEPGQPVQEPAAVEVDDVLLAEIVKRAMESESFTGFGEQLNEIVEAITTLNQAAETLGAQLATLQQDVTTRLAKLERGKAVERAEWVADLPAKASVTRVTLKSRFEQPADPDQEKSYAEIAANNRPSVAY